MIKKLSSVNLNTLVTLDALLSEQNTSKAAKKINITQSAVSQTLKKLRVIFEDELLIKGNLNNQMILTAKAKELKIPVREAIQKLEKVFLEENEFDPLKIDMIFTIGMVGYTMAILLPKIANCFRTKAPNLKINVYGFPNFQKMEDFEDMDIDLAIGSYSAAPKNIKKELLLTDFSVCVTDRNHKGLINNKLTAEKFNHYPQIFSHISAPLPSSAYKELKKSQHSSLIIPNIILAMSILKDTDYIAILPSKIAKTYKNVFKTVTSVLPEKTESYKFYQYWKITDNCNKTHEWIRNEIKQLALNI